jgi:hypothetical protein
MTIANVMPGVDMDAAQPAPTKVEGAAKQFEALMIAQMLKTAREENEDEQEDSTSGTMIETTSNCLGGCACKNEARLKNEASIRVRIQSGRLGSQACAEVYPSISSTLASFGRS